MNTGRMLKLAARIETMPPLDRRGTATIGFARVPDESTCRRIAYFHMGSWIKPVAADAHGEPLCQTAGCIAGVAVSMFHMEHPGPPDEKIDTAARRLLGLDEATAQELFVPWQLKLRQIRPVDAATAIRKVVEHHRNRTGKPGPTRALRDRKQVEYIWLHVRDGGLTQPSARRPRQLGLEDGSRTDPEERISR